MHRRSARVCAVSVQSQQEATAQRRLAGWWVFGVVGCVVIYLLVAYAIFESPVGSVFFMDDSPPENSTVVPFLTGVLLGFLQIWLFGVRIVLVSAVVGTFTGLLMGEWWWLMVATMFLMGVGALIGGSVAMMLPRRGRSRAVSACALAACAAVAVISLTVEPSVPEPSPLTKVLTPATGPAVIVDATAGSLPSSVAGHLADVDGCLGVVDVGPEAETFVVVWPPGATVQVDPYRLTTRGTTYLLGDRILVGGATLRSASDTRSYYEGAPATCQSHDLVL